MKNRVVGYVGTRDLNEIEENAIASLDVINIAFGEIMDGCVVWKEIGAKKGIERILSLIHI